MKEEIIAGLKQAIERGSSLEKAKQSFINAGYNSEEVEEAAYFLSRSLTQYQPQQQEFQQYPETPEPPQFQQYPETPEQTQPKFLPHPLPTITRKKPRRLIFLIIVLIILLAILGVSFFFRDNIIKFIADLF